MGDISPTPRLATTEGIYLYEYKLIDPPDPLSITQHRFFWSNSTNIGIKLN